MTQQYARVRKSHLQDDDMFFCTTPPPKQVAIAVTDRFYNVNPAPAEVILSPQGYTLYIRGEKPSPEILDNMREYALGFYDGLRSQ